MPSKCRRGASFDKTARVWPARPEESVLLKHYYVNISQNLTHTYEDYALMTIGA